MHTMIKHSPRDSDYGHEQNELSDSGTAKIERNTYSTQCNWSLGESAEIKAINHIDNETRENDDVDMVPFPRCSTPLVTEMDIDRFLDFQRARTENAIAHKRKGSEESDVTPIKKRNPFIKSKRRQSVESKQNSSFESKRNLTMDSTASEDNHYNVKTANAQLSNDAAIIVRSRMAPILDAEIDTQNQIRATCYFCEQQLQKNLRNWIDHLLKHTGEKEFYCTGCNIGLFSGRSTHCAGYKVLKTITSGSVTAFLCNTCDHVQFNMQRLIIHIMSEHMKSQGEAKNGFEQVLLIPDLRRVIPLSTKYKYVPNGYLYDCGAKGCTIHCNSISTFTQHFSQKHYNARLFSCPHCKEIITNAKKRDTKLFIDRILEHFKHHGDLMNQCVPCHLTFSTDSDIILHMLTHHADSYYKFYREIRSAKNPSIIQDVRILFDETNQAVRHYLNSHKSHHADFKLIQFAKEMNETNRTKFSMVRTDEELLFQRHFVCGRCNETLLTKAHLIRHHITRHRTSELNIELSKNCLTKSSRKVNSRFDQYLLYFCDNCKNTDHSD